MVADDLPERMIGKCVRVYDGDSVLLIANKSIYRIVLFGIDAPERSQPKGKKSADVLSSWIKGRTVEVEISGKGEDSIIFGIVKIGSTNFNEKMVENGMAWSYLNYSDTGSLSMLESKARRSKIGIWEDDNPIAPWEWRLAEGKAIEEKVKRNKEDIRKRALERREKDRIKEEQYKAYSAERRKKEEESKRQAEKGSSINVSTVTVYLWMIHNKKCPLYTNNPSGQPCPNNMVGSRCKYCGAPTMSKSVRSK